MFLFKQVRRQKEKVSHKVYNKYSYNHKSVFKSGCLFISMNIPYLIVEVWSIEGRFQYQAALDA